MYLYALLVVLFIAVLYNYNGVIELRKLIERNFLISLDAVKDGDVLKCIDSRKIFRIESGKRRWYSSADAYKNEGYPSYKMIACPDINKIPEGEHIQ